MNDSAYWNEKSLTEMVDYLLSTHHPYTKTTLESLWPLMDKVERVHGLAHPELSELKRLYVQLRDDLQLHLMKEENILFPYIRALASGQPVARPPFGTIANPVQMMTMEHGTDGAILDRMQAITQSFALPPDACNSFQALYTGLIQLVADLRQHIHFENTLLFPRAIQQEQLIGK